MKKLRVLLVLGALVGLVGAQATVARTQTQPSPRSGVDRVADLRSVEPRTHGRMARAAANASPSELECVARSRGKANMNLDCDDPDLPKNEPDIEVNPRNPLHMIASSNDYESCCDAFYTSFNGGKSWHVGDMSKEDESRTGSDPVTVFDVKHDTVIHSSLNYRFNERGEACDGDLVVSLSTDGGLHWPRVVEVADGKGCDSADLQIFNDKEWIVTDNNPNSPYYGRTYITWTAFYSQKGVYAQSPIMEAHSDDGGRTWTKPKEISGSSDRYCTYQEFGRAGQCDEDQFSVPTVAPNGTLYVAFQNYQHEAAWERGDLFEAQYMVVRSRDGGRTFSRPHHVLDLEDGTRDYPENVNGRQTLTGYQIRVNSAGNIVADPRNGRLYLVFSDNRAGRHDVDRPVTNTNVYLMTSWNGRDWRGPLVVSNARSDQWFPWVEVNPRNGNIGVVYHDRSYRDPDVYNTTLAEGSPGSLRHVRVSTDSSHPRRSLWFRAFLPPKCWQCATFHGDYINLDYGSDGRANIVWTDMRRYRIIAGYRKGYTENIFFARR